MSALDYDIVSDDLGTLFEAGPALVTFGEVMVRDTPADEERLERTRTVRVSMAGSEYTLAIALSRLGVPTAFVTRVPDNPYGWAVRDIARAQGVDSAHLVWAPASEPIGRYLYELGRTPRRGAGWYQRMYSAASKLGPGMVDWSSLLRHSRLLHSSGITFGLARHSHYEQNYCLDALHEALVSRPEGCLFGLDCNYRGTLWPRDEAVAALTPLLEDSVDILITTIEDMAALYGMGAGGMSAEEIIRGDIDHLDDDALRGFMSDLLGRFGAGIVGVTIRYPDSFESHRWESAAMDREGHFFRSPQISRITLWDRLGGGDTWNAGFYYGLLTEADPDRRLEKGVLVGDAATALKQTLMFDLPIITRTEVRDLMRATVTGGGKRTVR
jgi:2-dehydro-3-deoxygluconokinase